MITERLLRQTVPVAQSFSEDGISLSAEPNTVLSTLVPLAVPAVETTTRVVSQGDSGLSDVVQSYFNGVIGTVTAPEDGGLSRYESVTDGLVSDIAKFVNAHIKYARNVVQPIMQELVEDMREFADKYSDTLADVDYEVIVTKVPEPLLLEVIASDIANTRKPSESRYSLFKHYPPITSEETTSLIYTGSDRTNRAIAEWLSTKDEGWLANVYNVYFAGQGSLVKGMEYGQAPGSNTINNLSTLLAIYLLASKRIEEIPEGMDISAIDYKSQTNLLLEWAAGSLRKEMEYLVSLETLQTVVLEFNQYEQKVWVYEDTYKAFLEAGGTVEVVLGSCVKGGGYRNAESLLSRKEELIKEWELYSVMASERLRDDYSKHAKSFILNQFQKGLANMDVVEAEYHRDHPNALESIKEKADEYVYRLSSKDLEDPVKVTLTLVAEYRFCYTSAPDIFKSMLRASEINPDIDAREAALLAAIDYVTDFVISQIVIKR